jgi:hypothetical protein
MRPEHYIKLSDASKNRLQNEAHHRESIEIQRKYQRAEWIRWCVSITIAIIAFLLGAFGTLNSIFGWFTIL